MTGPEVRTPGGNRASAYNESADAPIVSEGTCLDKSFATQAALLALKGYSLHELSCGGFLVARADRTAHCSDLGAVRRFVLRLV